MSQENKMDIKVALMTVIALTALLGGQGFVMSLLLDPVKKSQARMEKQINARMDQMETRMDQRMDQMETRMDNLETRMDNLETRMDKLDSKMDLLLARNKP